MLLLGSLVLILKSVVLHAVVDPGVEKLLLLLVDPHGLQQVQLHHLHCVSLVLVLCDYLESAGSVSFLVLTRLPPGAKVKVHQKQFISLWALETGACPSHMCLNKYGFSDKLKVDFMILI